MFSWLYALIFTNIVCYFLPFLVNFGGGRQSSFSNFQIMFWKSNLEIMAGEYYRLLTSTFLHGDEMHLLINMWSLWSIGQVSIIAFGQAGFALIYFLSALGGSLSSFLFNSSPSVGASGAIFGLVGALLALGIQTSNYSLINSILINISVNAIIAFLPGSRLDNWGHLGGLVAGFTVAFLIVAFRTGIAA
jgi:rhomboid protease GluP